MKIEDLRIGNLVSVNNKQFHPNLKGAILRVTGLNERSSNGVIETSVNLECERETYSQFIEYIEPIPLTEHLLVDNGFEKSSHYNAYMHYDLEVIIKANDGKGYWKLDHFSKIHDGKLYLTSEAEYTVSERPIEYIHQLQNIFFILSGKEIDIKL